jgi:hypothetical protein
MRLDMMDSWLAYGERWVAVKPVPKVWFQAILEPSFDEWRLMHETSIVAGIYSILLPDRLIVSLEYVQNSIVVVIYVVGFRLR